MTDNPFRTGSHDLPLTPAFEAFMRTGWLDSERHDLPEHDVARWAARRRDRLRDILPGRRITVSSRSSPISIASREATSSRM